MKFFEGGLAPLSMSVLTRNVPAYVQFYVTARCNLACEQCNVIYANADQVECTTLQTGLIAENLAKLGTSVVLLTGGEPFVRKDIVEIAKNFISNGVHPRLQTNGLATQKKLEELSSIGAHDISISLDSLVPGLQDKINGDFQKSWDRAITTIAAINEIFPRDSFAALGCVLSPSNLEHIETVIRFATAIGWWVSLVPAHHTASTEPRSFSTFDSSLKFKPEKFNRVYEVLENVKYLRDKGFNVYDSDEYLDDILRFVTGQKIQWRRRNGDICDSPNLYFAITPNGDMAACCDYRMRERYPVYDRNFPDWYYSEQLRREAIEIVSSCTGCMYGSFPEISVSARYFTPMLRRAQLFILSGNDRRLKPFTANQMKQLASEIVLEFLPKSEYHQEFQ